MSLRSVLPQRKLRCQLLRLGYASGLFFFSFRLLILNRAAEVVEVDVDVVVSMPNSLLPPPIMNAGIFRVSVLDLFMIWVIKGYVPGAVRC